MMLKNNFWQDFLYRSENFTKPILLKNIITEDVTSIKDLLFQSLKAMTNEDVSPYGIWLDGTNRNELKKLVGEGINKDEYKDLDTFCSTFFEDYAFGFVAHHTNAYNEDLAIKFYEYLLPLYEILGVGLKGVDLNIFMGNYGLTPFGIHQDGKGENVIHFHLGPATKKMYLWEVENYDSIVEETFDEKVSKADFVFTIESGDLFFMPQGYYHIGNTPEYSTAITAWFCTPPIEILQKKIFMDVVKLISGENYDAITEFRPNITASENINKVVDETFSNLRNSIYAGRPIEDLLELRTKQHVYSLESSLNYTWPMLILDKTDLQTDIDNSTVQLYKPFAIKFFIDEKLGIIFAYVKGHEITFKYDHAILKVIEHLNSFLQCSFEYLESLSSNAAVREVLEKLNSVNGIQILSTYEKEDYNKSAQV